MGIQSRTVETLGRVAYRHLRDAEIVGIITGGGEERRRRVLEEDKLLAD